MFRCFAHRYDRDVDRVSGGSAEEVGFEPTVTLRPQRFSRPSDSSALALLQWTYARRAGVGPNRVQTGYLEGVPGSVRERSPGVWRVRVSTGRDPVTGRWRTTQVTVRGSETKAKNAAAKLYAEVADGRAQATTSSVGRLLDDWVAHLEARGRAPKTIHEYKRLAASIKETLGPVELRRLTGADIDRFYTALRARGLAPVSVRHYHTALGAALHQAVRWGWIDRSPMEQATPPGVEQVEPQAPTAEEIRALVVAAENPNDPRKGNPDMAALIFCAATTGCRRGELLALRWSDVDLELGVLVVRRSISDTPGKVEARTTKTNRIRRMALDPATVAVLTTQRARAAERCDSLRIDLEPEAYVWSQDADHSTPWRPDRVTDAFRRLRDDAGLGHVRFHHLRHFAATMMLAGGVDVRTAAGRLGHAQPSVTLKTYAHVLEAPDRSAAELLGRAMEA